MDFGSIVFVNGPHLTIWRPGDTIYTFGIVTNQVADLIVIVIFGLRTIHILQLVAKVVVFICQIILERRTLIPSL